MSKTLIIDVERCHDCNNCFLACKDEHVGNDFFPYTASQPKDNHRWIEIRRQERGQFPLVDVAYLPYLCMNCVNAPCIKAAKNDAVYRRDDGIVIIDPIKAKGQKNIVRACPYKVIYWNEKEQVPQKCNLCAHLLDDGWKVPRCVQACPTGALQMIDTDSAEFRKLKEENALDVLNPQFKTDPQVFYKNLYRFTQCFIAGSAAIKEQEECAYGAIVVIKDSEGKTIGQTETDVYGDFKVDQLTADNKEYRLEIEYANFEKQEAVVTLDKSINIGTIFF